MSLAIPGSENEVNITPYSDKPLSLWSEKDVYDWLMFHGLESCIQVFEPHSIDGEVLPFLNHDLLIEMGVDDEAARSSIITHIEEEAVRGKVKEKRRNTISNMKAMVSQQSTIIDLYKGNEVPAGEAPESGTNVNRYGFIEEEESPQAEEIRRKLIERENNRLKKWKKMAQTKGEASKTEMKYEVLKKNPKLMKRLAKGIPDAWRLMVWKWMAMDGEKKEEEYSRIYQECLAKQTKFDDENQIDLDINRTLRNHIEYKQRYGPGQKRLFNVLRAFANYVPEIGFCQGMATVAAFLLMYSDEETAFGMMVELVNSKRYQLKGLWQSGFPLLMEAFFVHNRLFKYHLPRLWKHFNNQKIHPSAYATRWYMTLFLCFPFQTSLRVWDIFLFKGFDALLFFSIAVLEYYQADLIKMEFEGIMEFLGQLSRKNVDDDKLVEMQTKITHRTYSSMPGKASSIQRLKDEYKKALADGTINSLE